MDWTDRVSGRVAKVPINHNLTLIENTKHISDWLKDYNQKYDMRYVAMYHATSKDAPILDEGILAGNNKRKNFGMSESGYVYLASTPQMAASFGSMAHNGNYTIYEVIVPVNKLLPDKNRLEYTALEGAKGNKLAQSLVYASSARVKGDIERWQIKLYQDERGLNCLSVVKNALTNEMKEGVADMDNKNKSLPDGWTWSHSKENNWGDLSSIEGGKYVAHAQYDYGSGEYRVGGNEITPMGKDFSIGFLEQLAIENHANEKEVNPSSFEWKWEHDNYDGVLKSPEGKIVAEYDYSTKEYKINGEWHFMHEDFALESLAQSAIAAYESEKDTMKIIQNEKELNSMSKYDIQARVNPLTDQSKTTKAMASVTIDDVIAINNLTVVEANNSLFVGYPKNKDKDGNFRDIVEFMRDEKGTMTKDAVELKDAIQKTLVDMFKSGERSTPEKDDADRRPVDHDIKVFVTPLTDSENSVRGLATVQVGELFKINSVRVNENTKEDSDNFGKLYVAMPARPDTRTEGGYKDIVHPVTTEFGDKLRNTVLKQYDNQLAWKENIAKKEQAAQQPEKPATNKSAPNLD